MRNTSTAAALLLVCLVPPPAVRAQSAPARPAATVEVWGGMTVAGPRMSGAIDTSFAPVVIGQAPAGSAGQALWLNGAATAGIEGGANYFVTPAFGVQVLLGYDRFDLEGRNDPYAVRLDYTSAQPPDYVPRSYTSQRTIAWPDTAGSMRQVTLAVNGVARWAAGRRWTGSVSAGLAVFDVGGTVQSLGYSDANLGGHSVLFVNDYKLSCALEGARSAGFDVGGGVEVRLAGRASLMADVRYFNGSDLAPAVVVRDIVNADEVFRPSSLDAIQQGLHPPAPRLSPARSRLLIGLKVGL